MLLQRALAEQERVTMLKPNPQGGRPYRKGQSGNPGGRPKGSKTLAIRELAAEACTRSARRASGNGSLRRGATDIFADWHHLQLVRKLDHGRTEHSRASTEVVAIALFLALIVH